MHKTIKIILGRPVIVSEDSDMGNVFNVFWRSNNETTEVDDAIHGAVERVDEAKIHALQTEKENLKT